MNKFFRAIGFSQPMTIAGLQTLINQVLTAPDYRAYVSGSEETLLAEFRMDFADNCGVSVCGEFDAGDQFRHEYCYPYFISGITSTTERLTVEPRIRQEGYCGVVDDYKVGVTLIYHLQNYIDFVRRRNIGRVPEEHVSTMLAGLSVEGTILMPIGKTPEEEQKRRQDQGRYVRMVQSAMQGNEQAMEKLTVRDMDTYAAISRQIMDSDVLSLVESYFTPYGVECDLYSVLGEIRAVRTTRNRVTDEELVQLALDVNGLEFALCINRDDLYGEPQEGRRFRGVVWMQGMAAFGDVNEGGRPQG